MLHRLRHSTLALAAVLLPAAAFADISGTTTLSSGATFNLDSGTTVTSGGDIKWTGTSITFVGSAKGGVVPGFTGSANYELVSQQILQQLGALASASPIPSASLPVGAIFAVSTNGGNAAKLLVTSNSGGSLGVQYTTYGATGGGGGPTGPTITQIQNNYSYILPGFPNYGIAPGTLFIIKGSGMSDPGTAVLQSSASPGIPATLNGASIAVTVNGTTTHPGIYYAIPAQIAAVLPSGTPAGTGTITVTYNGTTSAPATITVVQSALGLDTYYGGGTGLGVATNPVTGTLYNYNNSAKPGETIVLWGSGLGADTADSDTVYTTTPHAVSVPLQIYIGGVLATIGYQGSSGYPGVNQINVTIPGSVPPGCAVAVVAVSGSVVSNTVTLPVKAGGGTCSDPALGIDGNQILTLGGKTSYNTGIVDILQQVSGGQTTNIAGASFLSSQGAQQASGYGLVSIGNCIVNQNLTGAGSIYTTTALDPGTITVTGPAGSATLTTIPQTPGLYFAQLSSSFIPAGGGTFTYSGSGGKDVGAFTTSIAYTSPLNWTNEGSITAVNRAQGQQVTWSGGATNSYVIISGSSSAGGVSGAFTCYAPVSAGQFTVPSYVLLALPAGSGSLSLENSTTPNFFTASGLDYGIAIGAGFFSISPSYQ